MNDRSVNLSKHRKRVPAYNEISDFVDLQKIMRSHRKMLLRSFVSVRSILSDNGVVQERALKRLAENLTEWAFYFVKKDGDLSRGFLYQFFYFSLQLLSSGNIGSECMDDIIQLAECLVRSKQVFSIVGKDNIPKEQYYAFDHWLKSLPKHIPVELEDVVLAAVAVFSGVLTDPIRTETSADNEVHYGEQ